MTQSSLIADFELADMCVGSYEPDYVWDVTLNIAGIHIGIMRLTSLDRGVKEDIDVVCFRGSMTIEDWIRNLRAVPEITDHPLLGPLHAGFYERMEVATKSILSELRPTAKLIVTGHSLGAARAWVFSAESAKKPDYICVFASPKPGFPQFAKFMFDSNISVMSYRNATPQGHDRVTDLPPTISPELLWSQPAPLTDINSPPPLDDHSPFRFHSMKLYHKALLPSLLSSP